MIMFVVETPYLEPHEPGLQFVGIPQEIDALNERFVPLVLARLALDRADMDLKASDLLEHIGHWGTVQHIPNRNKTTALTILDGSWRDNLAGRRYDVMKQGAKGLLTSRQVSEEVALIGRLVGQPDFTWLTTEGYEAYSSEDALHTLTYAKPGLDNEGEAVEEESPWDAEIGSDGLELAQEIGATHIARHYQVIFASAVSAPGTQYPLPEISNLRLELGREDERGFHSIATIQPNI